MKCIPAILSRWRLETGPYSLDLSAAAAAAIHHYHCWGAGCHDSGRQDLSLHVLELELSAASHRFYTTTDRPPHTTAARLTSSLAPKHVKYA